jgi:hypothetical protein
VTTDAAAYQIGDREIATALLRGEPCIQVIAALSLRQGGDAVAAAGDVASARRYTWTSGAGPEIALTAGTTGELRVTIETRPPITMVLPFVKSLLEGGAD